MDPAELAATQPGRRTWWVRCSAGFWKAAGRAAARQGCRLAAKQMAAARQLVAKLLDDVDEQALKDVAAAQHVLGPRDRRSRACRRTSARTWRARGGAQPQADQGHLARGGARQGLYFVEFGRYLEFSRGTRATVLLLRLRDITRKERGTGINSWLKKQGRGALPQHRGAEEGHVYVQEGGDSARHSGVSQRVGSRQVSRRAAGGRP